MPFQINNTAKRKTRKNIDIVQNEFSGGYQSTIDNSRRKINSLSSMLNMELVQDNVVRPRPPMVRYGTQPSLPVIGRGEYRYNGERGIIWLFNDGGTGKLYRQADGGAFTLIGTGGTYDVTGWTKFVQSKGKVYPYNGINKLSYIKLSDWTIHTYTALTTPAAPTFSISANLSSNPKHAYYYRVTANNEVGESIASAVSAPVNVNTVRDGWNAEAAIAKTVTVSWAEVTGASSYTLYVGDKVETTNELFTTTIPAGQTTGSYTDDGSLNQNPFKLAPEGNSTEGFIAKWLYNDSKNSQIYGVSTDNKLYYSAAGTADFSPYNGGGWVTIDEEGDTELNFVDGFRNGKGDPVITTSSRGAAGKGILNHVTFETLTIGDQSISYPNVYPASGQSGTYAPRATVKARDALYYFTGQDVQTTGTSQNIVGILTTKSIGQVIEPDLDKINLQALSGAAGVEYKDRLYFALPVNSTTNNEIWYLDLSRKSAWVLRWTVAAKDLWLYEDNAGYTHFCALVDNKVMEFSRAGSQTHQDDGVPFQSQAGYSALTWDKAGITLGQVRNMYCKLLQPKGNIIANATGVTRRGVQTSAGSDDFQTSTSFTGYDIYTYDKFMYDEDPGQINSFGKSVAVLQIRPKGLLNQLSWTVGAESAGTDYILSSVSSRGWSSDELIMKTLN